MLATTSGSGRVLPWHCHVLIGVVLGALLGGAAVTFARPAVRSRGPADGVYYLNVKMAIKPERRDEFLAVIENNQRGTLGTEPNAIAYVRALPSPCSSPRCHRLLARTERRATCAGVGRGHRDAQPLPFP